MRHELEVKLGSAIVGRVDTVRMSRAERQVAVNAMHGADALADAYGWFAKKIEQMSERLFLKPQLKA